MCQPPRRLVLRRSRQGASSAGGDHPEGAIKGELNKGMVDRGWPRQLALPAHHCLGHFPAIERREPFRWSSCRAGQRKWIRVKIISDASPCKSSSVFMICTAACVIFISLARAFDAVSTPSEVAGTRRLNRKGVNRSNLLRFDTGAEQDREHKGADCENEDSLKRHRSSVIAAAGPKPPRQQGPR
jgi:hypothetical protein